MRGEKIALKSRKKRFVRKNANAFFSGQGLCPCRGPAAKRWSCNARNHSKKNTRRENRFEKLKETFYTEKCERIFLGSRTVSLSRSSGETLVVQRTKLFQKNTRRENRFEKLFFSPRAPLFPQTSDAFAIYAKALKIRIRDIY